MTAVHDPTAKGDHVGHIERDQVGQTQAQIKCLLCDGVQSVRIASFSRLTDSQGTGKSSTLCQGRTTGQNLPTAMRTTKAARAGRINDVVTNFGMRTLDA